MQKSKHVNDRIGAVAIGTTVKAFNPRKFGVIDHGRIVAIGNRWARVDFGPLNGGTMRVALEHVTEIVGD